MKSTVHSFTTKSIAACALFCWAAAFSYAQPVYRIVGPDGKVTFSDKPPAEPQAKVTSGAAASIVVVLLFAAIAGAVSDSPVVAV